jgi:hypothetical protein
LDPGSATERVEKEADVGGLEEKLLEDISNDVEKERGERVPLLKAAPTLDPPSRNSIEENSRLASPVEHLNPRAPKGREPLRKQDAIQSIPTDGVKSFAEIELEDRSRGGALVTRLNDIGSVDKVLRDRAAGDKTSLVWMDEEGNQLTQAQREAFGMNF